jgi:hypothetical protein
MNDAEYKKIYMKRLLSQINNVKAIATHLKQPAKVPKTVANENNNTKQDKAYKAKKFKTISFQIGLNMKKDKSAEDVQMGIVPPITDNRTTEQKVSDNLSQRSTAMKNAQLLFGDKEQALAFLDWLLADNQMITFFNEQFVELKTKFASFKNLLSNRVKIYLERLYQKELQTGGLDDPIQRSDFFGTTGLDSGSGEMYPTRPPDNDDITGSIHPSGSEYDPLMYTDAGSDETQSQQSRESLAADLAHFTENPELAQEHIDQLPSQIEAEAGAAAGENVFDENGGILQYHEEILNMFQQAYEPLAAWYFGASGSGNVRQFQKKRDFKSNRKFLMGVGLSLRVCTPDDMAFFNIGDDNEQNVLTTQVLTKINAVIKFVRQMYNKASPLFANSPNPTDPIQIGDIIDDINKAIVYCDELNQIQIQIQSPVDPNPYVLIAENAANSNDPAGEAQTYPPENQDTHPADNRDLQEIFDQHAAALQAAQEPELSAKQTKAAAAAAAAEQRQTDDRAHEAWLEQTRKQTAQQKETDNWNASLAANRAQEKNAEKETSPTKKGSSSSNEKAGTNEAHADDIALDRQIKLGELKNFKERRASGLRLELNKARDKYEDAKYRIEDRLKGYDAETQQRTITRETTKLRELSEKYETKKVDIVTDFNLETELLRKQEFAGMDGEGLKRKAPKKKSKAKPKPKAKARKY